LPAAAKARSGSSERISRRDRAESREPKTGSLRFIEGKGRTADAKVVIFTRNGMLIAFNAPDAYYAGLLLG
jgi:hypothetical protein